MLTSGSSNPAVDTLGRQLAELGYPNSVSRGENPYNIVDASVLDAVNAFRRDHGGLVEPNTPGPPEQASNWIGPVTWQAVRDALDAQRAQAPAPDAGADTPPAT
jgi:peptidoglycan hydrolase-like protein with peptidoglycan-binding domain